jgi:hypothetical protein
MTGSILDFSRALAWPGSVTKSVLHIDGLGVGGEADNHWRGAVLARVMNGLVWSSLICAPRGKHEEVFDDAFSVLRQAWCKGNLP